MSVAVSPSRRRDVRPDGHVVVGLLREVLVELRGIRLALLAHPRRPPLCLNREDRARLARLLSAIGGVFGSELFLTRELFESDAAAVQLVLRGLSRKQVGRLLRRGEGQVIAGYGIQRDGTELRAVLWRVVQLHEFSSVKNLSVPPRATREPVK